MSICPHDEHKLGDGEQLAACFDSLRRSPHIAHLQSVIMTTGALPGVSNMINKDAARSDMQKKRRKLNSAGEFCGDAQNAGGEVVAGSETVVRRGRSTIVYAMLGQRLCRAEFAAIVQLSPRTIEVHMSEQ